MEVVLQHLGRKRDPPPNPRQGKSIPAGRTQRISYSVEAGAFGLIAGNRQEGYFKPKAAQGLRLFVRIVCQSTGRRR